MPGQRPDIDQAVHVAGDRVQLAVTHLNYFCIKQLKITPDETRSMLPLLLPRRDLKLPVH